MKNKREIGITLVALVITIIILLILAGITISQLTGSGLFENSKLAKEKHENAQRYEEEQLAKYTNEIESQINSDRGTVTISEEEYNRLLLASNSNYYSSEEQIVGTWVDGKPIYQKTWTGLAINIAYNGWTNVVSIPNLETLVSTNLISNNNNNITGAGIEVGYDQNTQMVVAEYNSNTNVRQLNIITLQYTKKAVTTQNND